MAAMLKHPDDPPYGFDVTAWLARTCPASIAPVANLLRALFFRGR